MEDTDNFTYLYATHANIEIANRSQPIIKSLEAAFYVKNTIVWGALKIMAAEARLCQTGIIT